MKEYKDSEEIKRQLRIWIQECEDWLEQKEADCFRDCIDLLDEAPAADVVEVRHAKWTTRRTEMHDGEWYCTGCDYEPQVFENSNYCPNCGADMRERDKV